MRRTFGGQSGRYNRVTIRSKVLTKRKRREKKIKQGSNAPEVAMVGVI